MSTPGIERREAPRARHRVAADLLYRALRKALEHANSVRVAMGLVLLGGGVVAIAGVWAFARLADEVREGDTQAFDDAVLRYLAVHRIPWLENSLLEITALGTGLVVFMIVGVAALFLWLTRHKYSASLLLVATIGGLALNLALKLSFNRPRPTIIPRVTHVVSSSFPSGHAMSAAIVYATVAYLAARLMEHRLSRIVTMLLAAVIILLIGASRIYLGVHYPSDVLGGYVVGLAWAGFCMATLEVVQRHLRRNAPQELQHEATAPKDKPGHE